MDSIAKAIESTVQKGRALYPDDTNDYRDKNGILMCGKCHTPREILQSFSLGGHDRLVRCPVLCDCRKERDEKERQEIENMKALSRIQLLREQSLMDERLSSATFDVCQTTPHNERAVKICRKYADRFDEMFKRNQGLLMYGAVGTGKSFLSACIANQLLKSGVPVVMTSFVKLIGKFRSFTEDDATIDLLNTAKLLIIDDLGAERSTDYSLEKVYDVIDSRYRAKMPMILTTNVPFSEMKQTPDVRYQRIYDRVFENCYPIQFTGPSWRRKEASQRFGDMKSFFEED